MTKPSKSLAWGLSAGLLIITVMLSVYLISSTQPAPAIAFPLIDGRTLELKSLTGKPVLVTFWASNCRECLKEMPHLIKLYNELSGSGLEIIGVAMPYDPPNRVLEISEKMAIPYAIALDIEGNAVRTFGDVAVTPTSFLIAPDGRIAMSHIGTFDMEQLRATILTMLPVKS